MNPWKNAKLLILLALAAGLLCSGLTLSLSLRLYSRHSFRVLSEICGSMAEETPGVEEEMLESLKLYVRGDSRKNSSQNGPAPDSRNAEGPKGNDGGETAYLEKYGYHPADFRPKTMWGWEVLSLTAVLLSGIFLFAALWQQRRQKHSRIRELTRYLEAVNIGKPGTLIPGREDAFSHLQDEIYKTVTNLTQTKEAALKARAGFAENLANIAHQLKTPITAASLSLQLWQETGKTPYGEQIQRQLSRLTSLEEALLTLSRMDAGALKLKREPVDLYTALNLAADNLMELSLDSQVKISIADRGCVKITGDLEWTMEAFLNLMKNCMEHSPAGKAVFCDYEQNPLYTVIQIRDEGEGFSREDLPHIFERFYRGDGAKGTGVGIGLPLARALLEMENGTLSARNLPDGGACFEVRFYTQSPGPGISANASM